MKHGKIVSTKVAPRERYRIMLDKNSIISCENQGRVETFGLGKIECILFPNFMAFIDARGDHYIKFKNTDREDQFVITYKTTTS